MLKINGQPIDYKQVARIAIDNEEVSLGQSAKKNVERTRKAIEKAVDNNEIIYGVTTGFGAFKNTAISAKDVEALQKNLIMSHAVGVGDYLEDAVVRGMMFLMSNYLSKGHSGVRPLVIETLIEMLNKEVTPLVPEKGSVGSSGDLAPSAHVILVLIGQGEAKYGGETLTGAEAMKRAGISPIVLQAKEGLALINNTSCMTSIASITLARADQLLDTADIAAALSAEALRATPSAFDADVHRIKAHAGQVHVAERMRRLLDGSKMLDRERVQDQYSIRCIPQIHGAIREAVTYVRGVVNTEVNSVTDNPLIFLDDTGKAKVISGGNFHGEPVAIAMDTLGIALSELANVADRRIASLLDPATSSGLPAFLVANGGLHSGMMILQYTTAALASENKVLAHPSSVDSIPTSANVEDLVSMGTIGARKAKTIEENVIQVLAIELLVSCQAIDFRLQEKYTLGKGTAKAYAAIRQQAPYFAEDTVYYPYIAALVALISDGVLTRSKS
jgi:histidine ammonia-lyase